MQIMSKHVLSLSYNSANRNSEELVITSGHLKIERKLVIKIDIYLRVLSQNLKSLLRL
jgi:hypothetical protein